MKLSIRYFIKKAFEILKSSRNFICIVVIPSVVIIICANVFLKSPDTDDPETLLRYARIAGDKEEIFVQAERMLEKSPNSLVSHRRCISAYYDLSQEFRDDKGLHRLYENKYYFVADRTRTSIQVGRIFTCQRKMGITCNPKRPL